MQLIECRGCTLGLTLSIFPAATNWNKRKKKERQVRASEGFEGHRDKEGKREKAAGGKNNQIFEVFDFAANVTDRVASYP